MTRQLHSIEGEEFRAGFYGFDKTKVELGQLDPMTVQQFAGYSAATLSRQIIPKADAHVRRSWQRVLAPIQSDLSDTPLRPWSGKYFGLGLNALQVEFATAPHEERDELLVLINAASAGTEPVYYHANPFRVNAAGTHVALRNHDGDTRHIVDSDDFFHLTCDVLANGYERTWKPEGTYPEIKAAGAMIAAALNYPAALPA